MFTKYIYINIAVFINLHAAKSAVHTAKLGQYCLGGVKNPKLLPGGGGLKLFTADIWGGVMFTFCTLTKI